MKNIIESLNNSIICEGRVNLLEVNTMIIILQMIKEYKDMVNKNTVKFVENLFDEDELNDIIDTLVYWEEHQSPKSYNVLYKQLYGEKIIKLCDYMLEFENDYKKSWMKIKTELEKIQNK